MNKSFIPDERLTKNLSIADIFSMEKYHLGNFARGINTPVAQTYRDQGQAIDIWFKRKYDGYIRGEWKTYPLEFFFERLKECAQPRDKHDPLDLALGAVSRVRLRPGDYESPDAVAKYIKDIFDGLSAAGVYKRAENEHKMSDDK